MTTIPKETTVTGRGVTVDLICWRHYRRRCREATALVLDANPGLAALAARTDDLTLPIGTKLTLPALPQEAASDVVTLWD